MSWTLFSFPCHLYVAHLFNSLSSVESLIRVNCKFLLINVIHLSIIAECCFFFIFEQLKCCYALDS